MISAGFGGPITGKVADLAIIEDPLKNRKEAESEFIRTDVINWYKSVLRTSWHPEDLAGHLIKKGDEKWTVINLSAIAKDNDPLGTAPGTPLCPELHDMADP